MKINVIVFGQIADITGKSNLTIENVANTNELLERLAADYPALNNTKFAIAVDKKIVKQNTPLSNNNTIALLPPFSGG